MTICLVRMQLCRNRSDLLLTTVQQLAQSATALRQVSGYSPPLEEPFPCPRKRSWKRQHHGFGCRISRYGSWRQFVPERRTASLTRTWRILTLQKWSPTLGTLTAAHR
jgi:hypothetical protein